MKFVNEYFLKVSKQTPLIPGAKDVIDMLQKEGNKLIIISARGGMIGEMEVLEQNENLKEVSNFGRNI